MRVLLVSQTNIVQQIFQLICKKMDFTLEVMEHNNIKEHYDIIVLDNEFIDERFNIIRQLCKRMGAITNEDLSLDKTDYFKINRPFLPMQLQTILTQEVDNIALFEKEQNEKKDEIIESEELASFVDSLADELTNDEEIMEDDESIVTLESLNDGGVLDTLELNKINTILDKKTDESLYNNVELQEEDWKELSEIIDEALTEVQGYNFASFEQKPVNLILNNYNIEELRPLLKKFDQGIIDKLSNGESVDLKISLKVKDDQ